MPGSKSRDIVREILDEIRNTCDTNSRREFTDIFSDLGYDTSAWTKIRADIEPEDLIEVDSNGLVYGLTPAGDTYLNDRVKDK